MLEVTDISIEKICSFSKQTQTLVTVDAPLYGSLLILEGKVQKGKSSIKEPLPDDQPRGLPTPEEVVQEASRFWIQSRSGVRDRKNRDEMSQLLEDI